MSGATLASARRVAMRALLDGERCVHPASVFDPLSAIAAQDLGFECAMLGGSVASLVLLGAPDLGLITLDELAGLVRRICRASAVPLLVDADHGYGNALNVRRTVQELEGAGAAAISIEETLLPASFGGSGEALTTVDEAVGKLRAAVGAREDSALAIVGRTNAGLQTLAQLLERQRRFEDTGIDAFFVARARSLDVVEALAANARVPLVLAALPAGADAAWLAARKVRVCLKGHQGFANAVALVYSQLAALRGADAAAGGTAPDASETAPQLVQRLSGTAFYDRLEQDYLR